MNYIWDVIVKAKNKDIDLKNISFKLASSYSAYMELSTGTINFNKIEDEVEINPYYRFAEIFKDLFAPNYGRYEELRTVFLDIVIHFLSQVDIQQGLDKVEYRKKFIYREIKNGYFGEIVKEGMKYFSLQERNIFLQNIYKFYNTGNHIYYLKDSLKRIFGATIFYVSRGNENEVITYINRPKNRVNLRKLKVLKAMFLPVNFRMITYWQEHFGIIGVAETMEIGKISIFQREARN